MNKYQIAGLTIAGEELPACFENFRDLTEEAVVCTIRKVQKPMDVGCGITETYQENAFLIQKLQNKSWIYYSSIPSAPAALLVSPDYQMMEYDLPETSTENWKMQQKQLEQLLRVALECLFIRRGVVSLHAACIEYREEGIAFAAGSGVGKSTRAQQWVEQLDAKWISGDRPALSVAEGKVMAYGVPWDGKEQIFRAVERPLKTILEVRRSSVNRMRMLTPLQAERLLAAQSFIPMWDVQTAALALWRIQRIAAMIPVYRAFCDKDDGAAREISELLFEQQKRIGNEMTDMKIKNGFTLTDAVGEYMVMPIGDNIKKFGGAVVLNEVSAFIFQCLQSGISKEDLLEQVLTEYDVDRETAAQDLDEILHTFDSYGMLETDGN